MFAKFCVCDRNRRQVFATVCGDAVRLFTVASASGAVPKACQIDCLSPQLFWCLQRRCLWSDRWRRSCIGAEGVSVRVICVAAVILAFAAEVSVGVICGAAVMLAFAEEVSVRVICVTAVISVFAEEVSVGVN